MSEYREIAKMLRQLIQNTESADTHVPAMHILALSEVLDFKADEAEMDIIMETQRNATA